MKPNEVNRNELAKGWQGRHGKDVMANRFDTLRISQSKFLNESFFRQQIVGMYHIKWICYLPKSNDLDDL